MQGANLTSRSILIVQDEPLIALHIGAALDRAAAIIVTAPSLPDAIRDVEQDVLSGAILDFGLGNEDADALCGRLKQRAIPFVLHSGYRHVSDACHGGIVVAKPANPEVPIVALLGAQR